jgi:hypothetical protein
MLSSLQNHAYGSFVEGFSTANVLFLLALQPNHRKYHESIVTTVQERWGNQIVHWNVADEQLRR